MEEARSWLFLLTFSLSRTCELEVPTSGDLQLPPKLTKLSVHWNPGRFLSAFISCT